MPEVNELAKWAVPKGWGKWIYGGTISILLGIILVMGNMLDNCLERNERIQDTSDKRMEKWLDQVLEEKLHRTERDIINPKIEEVREIADSIKTVSP